MIITSVLIVLFVIVDSLYLCLRYQDPCLSSLERRVMLYLLPQEHQNQASFVDNDQQMLSVVYHLRVPVGEADYCYQSLFGLEVENFSNL